MTHRKIIITLTSAPFYRFETTDLSEANKFCRFLDKMGYLYDSEFKDSSVEIVNLLSAY